MPYQLSAAFEVQPYLDQVLDAYPKEREQLRALHIFGTTSHMICGAMYASKTLEIEMPWRYVYTGEYPPLLRGLLAHELSHLASENHQRMCTMNMLYMFTPPPFRKHVERAIKQDERKADEDVIRRGFGNDLLLLVLKAEVTNGKRAVRTSSEELRRMMAVYA